jgi:hypothetical protein
MNRKLLPSLAVILLISGIPNLFSQNVERGVRRITPALMKEYIDFLASDSLKGRDIPGAGLDAAADYIADHFESYGILKINGSYFQKMAFLSKNLDIQNSYLKISDGEGEEQFELKKDFIPYQVTADTAIYAGIVFAGYGITAPEYGYDDYSGMDVKGRIVLIMNSEPQEKDPASIFLGRKMTEHSSLDKKIGNAVSHGAAGVLVVTPPLHHLMITPQGYPWPSLSKFLPKDNLPIVLEKRSDSKIPAVQVGEGIVKYLFGSRDSLENIQKMIDSTLKPCSFPFHKSKCSLSTKLIVKKYYANNVAGYIRGSDRKKSGEIIVIGAHYDHVGIKRNYQEEEDYIYNGADDNASGTAGVMAVAKAFSDIKKPLRSVLFILFAGEEMGLCGSSHYCDNPLFPLDKTVAMLNMDMIGRNGDDTLQIEGSVQNQELTSLLLEENKKSGLKYIKTQDELFGSSDHYNFFIKGVSAVDITSGLHKDYHTVYDNPDRINHVKASRIADLVFRTAWRIANEDIYFKTGKENAIDN